jgi:hypothetical protein
MDAHEHIHKPVKVWRAVVESIPPASPFTLATIAARIQVRYPNQDFNRQTIKRGLQKLCQAGQLRRLGRDAKGFILWAAPTCDADASPYGNTPASHLMVELLKESAPLRLVEVVVALQEIGYRERDNPARVLHAIRKALLDNPDKFIQDCEGRWTLLPGSP